jgi:LCP family protein required for cell wall assembly
MPPSSSRLPTYTSYTPASHRPAPTPERPNFKPSKIRRFGLKRSIVWAVLLIVATVIITGGFLGWKFYENVSKVTGDKNPLDLFSLFVGGPLQETNGRINILLAGNSADDPNHQGAALTDSIMVVSVDPAQKSAVLLSIPRDMWVDIPGYGYQKINAAYEDGGMALLSQVVQQDFAITPDYTALIDYTAFKDAVNTVGGIRIDIQSPDPRGIYDAYTHLNLPNGWVTLDGQQALDLARARGDASAGDVYYGIPDSDFTRTMYQREMLVALKNKAVTPGFLTNPFKVASLADAVGNNVTTNMSLGNMVSLYNDAKNISNNNVQSLNLNSINGQDLISDEYIDGQDVLVPSAGYSDFSQIQSVISSILYPTAE